MEREFELELVRRMREGDEAAFDIIYQAFNRRLYNFLARLTRRREQAEDLLEETWLRLVTHADRLQPDTRLAPWLFTVARNLHVSHCRSVLAEDAHPGLALWPVAPARSPFDEAAAREFDQQLEAALASLPVHHREVLLLVGVEGLTPQEAATACGISAATLRQRLHRARALLEERLGEAARPRTIQRTVNE